MILDGDYIVRKYYIDNIRWLCILLLFPYHTFMIYNSFGENFYIKGPDVISTTGFIIATSPWFMPLLFVIAGISSAYALQKKTADQYRKERIYKLLIPFLFGLLLIVPAQTYFAERFHNQYAGGYLQQYILFFTKPTDLTGNTGGFTPAHLWFILYLFNISLVALPIMVAYQSARKKLQPNKLSILSVLSMFIIPLAMTPILDIGGKSFGEFFSFFMLGYLLLSNEELLLKLDQHRFVLLIISAICMVGRLALWVLWWRNIYQAPQIAFDVFTSLYGWSAVLCILGLGRHYLNFRNKLTDYLSASSFPVYLFHQTWLIAVAYYVVAFVHSIAIQMLLIMLISLMLTYATYEVCRRIPITRFLFGIKP